MRTAPIAKIGSDEMIEVQRRGEAQPRRSRIRTTIIQSSGPGTCSLSVSLGLADQFTSINTAMYYTPRCSPPGLPMSDAISSTSRISGCLAHRLRLGLWLVAVSRAVT